MSEHPIAMRELLDEGVRLPAWGRFDGAELIFCIVMLPTGARSWTREPNEPCEIFSARVTRDIVESVRGRCDVLLTA